MKRFVFLLACAPIVAHAVTPSTSCPSGYTMVDSPNIIIATSCPSGYTAIGDAESCLVYSPAGTCIMYAPSGVPYTDEFGTYDFTDVCPMT